MNYFIIIYQSSFAIVFLVLLDSFYPTAQIQFTFHQCVEMSVIYLWPISLFLFQTTLKLHFSTSQRVVRTSCRQHTGTRTGTGTHADLLLQLSSAVERV